MGRGFCVTVAHVCAVLALLIVASAASPAIAAPIFTENFEGNLSAWVGQNGGSHTGQIVSDPLRAGNKVLELPLPDGGVFPLEVWNYVKTLA